MNAEPIVPFDPARVDFIRRTLSVAETGKPEWDPGVVYFYDDGPRGKRQATLSIGFTASGNLKKVLQRYIQRMGAFGTQFTPYFSILPGNLLADNKEFAKLCREAASDREFKQVQIECFTEIYLEPAFRWASKNAFALPLSYLVIADSYLHSGSMLDFLMNSFAEKKPAAGGNEKKWIKDYLDARRKWLANHSNKILQNTVYRVDCYLQEIASGNWELVDSLVMNGTEVAALV
jgi:chitosanase